MLTIFNTLSKEKELFKPLNPPRVGLYTCGPTVYDYPHIGNYRAYVFGDLLKRYLKYSNFEVKHVMNITDVDDKTIKKAKEENKELKEITEFYTKEFFKDIKKLNIQPADIYPKATDYINEMVELIEDLINKGFAYKTKDGSVYFNIKKFPEYGKLSNIKLGNLKENAQSRLADEYDKDNPQDFALWKADQEVFWETSLGKGRPGWHIECSAMSMKNLGESFDIHTGGVDNIFPHHENEIAQSECSTGKPFSKYFLHNEHLLVNGKKMSKSENNFYTLKDVNPMAFRYWLYTAHYRTRVNFTFDAIKGVNVSLNRLKDFIRSVEKPGQVNKNYKARFIEYLDNDLNSPKTISLLWELVKDSNIKDEDKLATIFEFDKVFGFNLDKIENIPQEVLELVKQREKARKKNNWLESDKLRDQISKLGYNVKDTKEGARLSLIA
ncbi:MAG: cysteine--tRNA ligase [Patescibacteria group bacterium]|nr:cysteine--tRNA ligase [Patescibacteria group bacterium]